jgi:iron complex outermembrane receptor protein
LSQGATNAQELTNVLPNVQNGVAGYAIRGISSGDTTEKGDPSTAFSVDGIYIARPQEQGLAFYDVDRVEVLRGPQGTLYGRNATAGAINVITARPVLGTYEGAATVDFGNYSSKRVNAMTNVPFGDNVALRLAGLYDDHDGYTPTHDGTNSLDSRNDGAGRARLLIKVADTNLLLSGDVAREHDSGAAYIPLTRALSGQAAQDYQNPGRNGFNHLNTGGFSGEITSDLVFADLTYIGGWRTASYNDTLLFGDDGPWVLENVDHWQSSHELRLASKGTGPLQWVGGLFYFNENTHTSPTVNIPGAGLTLLFDLRAHTESKAAFAQLTYSVLPQLRIVGGIRYTEDQKSRAGTFDIVGGPGQLYDAAVSFNKVNWKGGIEWDVADHVLFYASASTGYKSGGFNDGNPQTQPNLYYQPETITDYEAGLKGRFFDNRLYLSTSVFDYLYKGLQLSSVPPTGGIVTLNAASATIRGFETEGNWRVIEGGSLDYSLALLHAKYDNYLPLGAGGPSYAGYTLDRSPKAAFRVGYTQDFPVFTGKVRTNIATKYSSSYTVTDFNIPMPYEQNAFWRTDASVAYHSAGERWSVQAYVQNIENKRQLGVISFSSFTMSEPRLFGVRGHVEF